MTSTPAPDMLLHGAHGSQLFTNVSDRERAALILVVRA